MSDEANVDETDVTNLSDEELGKQLNDEAQEETEPAPQAADTGKSEGSTTPEAGEVGLDKTEPQSFQTPDDEIAHLKQKLAAVSKSNKDRDDWIKRRDLEIGHLRREKEELSKNIPDEEKIRQSYFDDPIKGAREVFDIDKKQARIKELEAKEQALLNRISIEQAMPNYSELVEDMVSIAKEDGEDENLIELFKKDPYALRADYAVQYARRALDRKKSSEVSKRIGDLEKKIAELEGKPASIVQKINNVGKNRPIAASSGTSVSSKSYDDLTEIDWATMSDQEFAEQFKKA